MATPELGHNSGAKQTKIGLNISDIVRHSKGFT